MKIDTGHQYWVVGKNHNSSREFSSVEEIADSVRLGEVRTPGRRGLTVTRFEEVPPRPTYKKVAQTIAGGLVGYLFYNTVGMAMFGFPQSPVGSAIAVVAVGALALSAAREEDRPFPIESGRLMASRKEGKLYYQPERVAPLLPGARELGPSYAS